MQIVENEQVVYFDVDDTLVKWDDTFTQPGNDKVAFLDPYDNSINYLTPHKKHIALLKKYKGRKNLIIVHSAAGVMWVKSVIQTLKLEEYVDICLTKSTKYVDDLPCKEWMGTHLYFKDS